jgi:5-hydroxyisourate hydrolase
MFFAGDYFAAQATQTLPSPRFLDRVVIRFGVAAADQHYHVPLLISPYGYSTYRGS